MTSQAGRFFRRVNLIVEPKYLYRFLLAEGKFNFLILSFVEFCRFMVAIGIDTWCVIT